MKYRYFLFFLLYFVPILLVAKPRCDNTPGRSWWDVQHYNLNVNFDLPTGEINGYNIITAKALKSAQSVMELDMQLPMVIDSIVINSPILGQVGALVPFMQEDDVCFVMLPFAGLKEDDLFSIKVLFHGKPHEAANAPWDGGIVRKKDGAGNHWLAMACEGVGASVWWPCKDIRSDEADNGMDMYYTCPDDYTAIGNGKLIGTKPAGKGFKEWHWAAKAPINNYNVTFYIGKYETWQDTFKGETGSLRLSYYVLKGNKAKALKHFQPLTGMLRALEYWLGPYPFYEDGYKLVEAPYLGMEHQSAVAWGNNYKMGYNGVDRSGTGYGLLFDFLIAHETAHEWFGNNITAASPAEMWIQEGFTSYAEALYLEELAGKEKAFAYQRGKWQNIRNDEPTQGSYEQCTEGSTDHYDKAGAMVHMIRRIIDNDSLFRQMLRGMNSRFRHQIVSAQDIRSYINKFSGRIFDKVFDQYLLMKDLPVLAFRQEADGRIQAQWQGVIKNFDMPVFIDVGEKDLWIYPTEKWKDVNVDAAPEHIRVDDAFLVKVSGGGM